MRADIIRIHALAPAKPALGASCNGCGVCCLSQPCPVGIIVSRRWHGACRALRWDDPARRYRCAVADPKHPMLAALARRWIAAGLGCDSGALVRSD